MARVLIAGAETGGTSELAAIGTGLTADSGWAYKSATKGGNYSYKAATTHTGASTLTSSISPTLSRVRFKAAVRVDSATNPATSWLVQIASFYTAANASAANVYMTRTTSSTWTLDVYNAAGTFVGSSGTLSGVDTTSGNRIEIDLTIGAGTGAITVYLDGVSVASFSSQAFGASNIGIVYFGTQSGDTLRNVYFDDMELDDAALCGDSYVIARQGTAGSPTYTAWTLVGGANIQTCWSETPFSTANAANSGNTTLSRAQTMMTASFSSTQSGHGSGVIVTGDTINGAKVAVVAKTSSTTQSGAVGSIRRRFGGVDTDTSVTLTTSDAYYSTAIFTPTLTDLNASEIGFLKGTSTANKTQTVEDVWAIVSYTPSNNKTLTAAGGSYALTGTAATLKQARLVTASGGSYALTGTAATLRHNYPLVAGGGSYSLTGTAASLLHKWIASASGGSYSLSGTAASLKHGWAVIGGAGSYALSGQAVTFVRSYVMTASSASYALSGTSASLLHGWSLGGGSGSYALTGTDVTLVKGSASQAVLTADAGSYSLSGTDATLTHLWVLSAGTQTYDLTGSSVGLLYSGALARGGDDIIRLSWRRRH